MSHDESIGTMRQGSYVKISEGVYAQRITGTAGGESASPIEVALPVVARTTSTFADGKVTAPGAATNIALTSALDAGTWDVEVTTFIGGTTVATLEMNNMAFKIGSTQLTLLGNAVPGTAGATGMAKYKCRVDIATPTPLSVATIAAATAGSIYYASIIATRAS